jgi:hypothetical protein
MSFSISDGTTALSLLQSAASSSGSTSLISIINGGGSGPSGDPVANLIQAENNQTKDVAQQENDPTTKNEIAHFESVAKSATSLQQLLSDPIAAKVFLTANGLGDQVQYTALAVKALSSDTTQTGNFASTLPNPAWVTTAQAYSFNTQGLSVLQTPSSLSAIATNYATVVWETSLDQSTPGLSAALDFRSRASQFTTADQILGDANVRAVVTGALGIPEQIAYQPLEAQEKAITDHLDISKLQDPKFVENLAREYLLQNASSTSSGSSSGSILSLFT